MKRKLIALLLALSMCLSLLSACGSGNTATDDKPPESGNAASSTEQSEESEKPEESEEPKENEPEESEGPTQEPEQKQPEELTEPEPAIPAEMTYTFDAATGTVTCSGGGEITAYNGYIDAIKNTLFETDEYKCRQEIKKVVIEDGVTAIGSGAFEGLAITEIAIPDSVTRIGSNGSGYGAFSGTPITSITIPDSVTELYGEIFQDCKNLSSVTLSKNLTFISSDMFRGCSSLTSIQIPEGVTRIGSYAFASSGLTSVTLPDGLTYIGDFAFSYCPITELTIPASVTELGSNALRGCDSLTDVTFLGDTDMDHVWDLVGAVVNKPVTVHAHAGSVIEGYLNRQISQGSVKCTFAPIG